MDPGNPYQPPLASSLVPPASSEVNATGIPVSIFESMQQTKPWVTMFGIAGFIACGLLGVAGLVVMALGGSSKLPNYAAAVYIPLVALYIAPSLYLYRYGKAIREFMSQRNLNTLAEALQYQKSFWRYLGILMLVVMGIYGVIVVGAIVLALGTRS